MPRLFKKNSISDNIVSWFICGRGVITSKTDEKCLHLVCNYFVQSLKHNNSGNYHDVKSLGPFQSREACLLETLSRLNETDTCRDLCITNIVMMIIQWAIRTVSTQLYCIMMYYRHHSSSKVIISR